MKKLIDELVIYHAKNEISEIELAPSSCNSEVNFHVLDNFGLNKLKQTIQKFVDNPTCREIWTDGDYDEPSEIVYLKMESNEIQDVTHLEDLLLALHRALQNECKIYVVTIECYV